MREIVFNIQRFDGEKSFTQAYRFAHEAGRTVLWGLIHIKETLDPTLTFVASCRSAVCGACAVRVNGQAMLACEAALDDVLARFGDRLEIAPLNNFPLIRDLVVDWEPKTERLKAVNPWLIPREQFSAEGGCRQTPAEFKKFSKQTNCMLCGACASECSKLTQDSSDFLEPFIFTAARKFVDDSRDGATDAHLKPALAGGVWKCMHCQECVTKCPKALAPAEDIAKLRQTSLKQGLTGNLGARHALAFYDDIKHTGRLNEMKMALKTEGMIKSMARLPFALRLLRRGKMNPLHWPAPVKGIKQIRAILRAVEEAEQK